MGIFATSLGAAGSVIGEIGGNLESSAFLDADSFEALCEMYRSRGQSGIVNTRQYNYGGSTAYFRNGIAGYSAHNIHDHPDHQAMPGMAEVAVCINGIYLRTRHNDYKLNAPVANGTYLQTAEIPLPAVPASVLAKPTVQEQVDEMREYFRAFVNGDSELRDYEPHFRWSMSYLEIWPEVLTAEIADTFSSDRHGINVNNLRNAIDKHLLYTVSGHQDRPENTPFIPFIVRSVAVDGRPQWSLIRYRICAVDVGSVAEYAPADLLKYRDQFALRLAANRTAEQMMNDRRCRFEVMEPEGQQLGPTLVDELMAKVPGLNGGGTLVETFNDTGTPYNLKRYGSNTEDLNAAFYNRFFSIFFTASGRANVRRGWNDPTLWVASTTRPEVAAVLDPTMNNAPRRYSYAIPLELVLRTPLEAWNPHNIPAVADPTMAGARTGSTPAAAYTGYRTNGYNWKVPQAFYSGATVGDPADTGAGSKQVLDGEGNAQAVRGSGIYVITPPIAGIGANGAAKDVRLRYPIAPAYDEGSYQWAYCEALQQRMATMWDQLKAGGN